MLDHQYFNSQVQITYIILHITHNISSNRQPAGRSPRRTYARFVSQQSIAKLTDGMATKKVMLLCVL